MGRFESNSVAPRHRHYPPRDSCDLDGRLSGSRTAFKVTISAQCNYFRADSSRKDCALHPIRLFVTAQVAQVRLHCFPETTVQNFLDSGI